MTNAIKYAFDGRAGYLSIETRETDGVASITVTDDGPGLPDDIVVGDGLGRKLIDRLSRQINGTATWSNADPGTCVMLTFPAHRA